MKIAVVGATGLVGTVLLQELATGDFRIPIDEIVPIASESSVGSSVKFGAEMLKIVPLEQKNIPDVDIAFFAVGDEISKKFSPLFVQKGAIVIDKSNAFRRDKRIPLVVPEVNADVIGNAKLIACPNCSTIQLVVALAPLKRFGIRSVTVATYQAISGAGRDSITRFIEEWEDLWDWLEGADLMDLTGEHPYRFDSSPPLFANVIPQIGSPVGDGSFSEEDKIRYETSRILNMPQLPVSATAVRVPVFNVHSEAVSVELKQQPDINEITDALNSAEGIVLSSDVITPADVSGTRKVFISRLRTDTDRKNTVHLWVLADNLRKGAATNAIQIAEIIAQKNL